MSSDLTFFVWLKEPQKIWAFAKFRTVREAVWVRRPTYATTRFLPARLAA